MLSSQPRFKRDSCCLVVILVFGVLLNVNLCLYPLDHFIVCPYLIDGF